MNLLQCTSSLAILAAVLGVGCGSVGETMARGQGAAKMDGKHPHRVLIIRHSEKTGAKSDTHLAKRGKERAEALFQLFKVSKHRLNPFSTPDYIFAASNSASSRRPVETVTPLALKLRLPIDSTHESKRAVVLNGNDATEKTPRVDGMRGLRAELFAKAKYHGKTILVSWRHSSIPELAKTLGANDAPAKWDEKIFDRVWQLTYDDIGSVTFHNHPQQLLPDDAEE